MWTAVVLWRAITEYARRDRRYGGAIDVPGAAEADVSEAEAAEADPA